MICAAEAHPQKTGSKLKRCERAAFFQNALSGQRRRCVTFCGRGGARERMAYFSANGKKISRNKADFAPTWLRGGDLNHLTSGL